MTPTVIRLILSIVLLVLVWLNSHWSVALTITLIGARMELDALIAWISPPKEDTP